MTHELALRQAPFWPDSSALLCPTLVSSFNQENGIFSLQWKEKAYSQNQRGTDLHREKSLPLTPDWFTLVQMRAPSPQSLVGPKSTV